jgi:putative redox protein
MELLIDFPGGATVEAHFENFSVLTDRPLTGGGKGAAPTSFSIFLASIGTCAGAYVLAFCRERGLITEGIRIIERVKRSPVSGLAEEVELEIQVPPGFPLKYYDALVRSVDQCTIKKQFEFPPVFKVHTSQVTDQV